IAAWFNVVFEASAKAMVEITVSHAPVISLTSLASVGISVIDPSFLNKDIPSWPLVIKTFEFSSLISVDPISFSSVLLDISFASLRFGVTKVNPLYNSLLTGLGSIITGIFFLLNFLIESINSLPLI